MFQVTKDRLFVSAYRSNISSLLEFQLQHLCFMALFSPNHMVRHSHGMAHISGVCHQGQPPRSNPHFLSHYKA